MPLSNEVQALIHAHIGLVSVCVLIYDHLITFADEVTYIWARPKYISSVLFLVNRYLGCFSNTLQMATLFMKLPPDVSAGLVQWISVQLTAAPRMYRRFIYRVVCCISTFDKFCCSQTKQWCAFSSSSEYMLCMVVVNAY
ncbi:hypothetical protein V8B97DRAFT_829300 [Scleroderma yunnanense]